MNTNPNVLPSLFRRLLGVMAMLAIPVTPAKADVGPIGPPGFEFQVHFENLDDYSNYDFYLKFRTGRGEVVAWPQLKRVKTAGPTHLGRYRWISNVHLLAVPRGQRVPTPPLDREYGNGWLAKIPEGALQSGPLAGDSSGTPLGEQFNGHTIRYRVDITGGRLEVSLVKDHAPMRKVRVAAGVGLSTIAIVLGFVWLRRSRRVQPGL